MKKSYFVYDKITDELLTVVMAVNEKDAVRNLVYSGIFKFMRKEDIVIKECEIIKKKEKEIDFNKTLKALSIEIESKAEEIKGKANEVSGKINKECGGK